MISNVMRLDWDHQIVFIQGFLLLSTHVLFCYKALATWVFALLNKQVSKHVALPSTHLNFIFTGDGKQKESKCYFLL